MGQHSKQGVRTGSSGNGPHTLGGVLEKMSVGLGLSFPVGVTVVRRKAGHHGGRGGEAWECLCQKSQLDSGTEEGEEREAGGWRADE